MFTIHFKILLKRQRKWPFFKLSFIKSLSILIFLKNPKIIRDSVNKTDKQTYSKDSISFIESQLYFARIMSFLQHLYIIYFYD